MVHAIAEGREASRYTSVIPRDFDCYIEPVFEELSIRSLLECGVLGETPNQKEFFNYSIWSRCLKTGFCSLVTREVAVSLVILTFNNDIGGGGGGGGGGLLPLFEHPVGSPPETFTAEYFVTKAEQNAEDVTQRRRKSLYL